MLHNGAAGWAFRAAQPDAPSGTQSLAVKTFQDVDPHMPLLLEAIPVLGHPPPTGKFQTTLTFPAPLKEQMVCKMFLALNPGRPCLRTLAVVPFTTTVLFDHLFVEGFVGTSLAKQCSP